jgi:hypothetical protein
MYKNKTTEVGLIALLSGLIHERDNDTPFQSSEQDDALKGLTCSEPRLGRRIEGCDFPFLIETLKLDDQVFAKEFPGVTMTAAERRDLKNALEEHCESCPRCRRKRASDLEWQARVHKAIADNKQLVGEAIARAAGRD